MADKSFARKYGLIGKGYPIKISKRTRETVKALYRQSEAIRQAGEDWAKLETRRFG